MRTQVADHYFADASRRVRNVPSRLSMDPDGKMLNNLLIPTEHQFSGGYYQHMSGHTAEAWEEVIDLVMCNYVHDKAKRAAIMENYVALVMTELSDMVVSEATDEAEAEIESRQPHVVLSGKTMG